jgi:methenyltetrahydrofolate cyclohydrolase
MRTVTAAGDRTISSFLEALAAREPAPGGGAAAALHAAQGAALVAMVAVYSDRGDDQAAIELAQRIAQDAESLRLRATDLIQGDMDGFGAVASAYRMPKDTDADKAARRQAIAEASIAAAQPPADVIDVASRVVELCRELLPIANRNVITDVAAAADAARAAAATARVNVEINLGSVTDEAAKARFMAEVDSVDALVADADAVSADVRGGL